MVWRLTCPSQFLITVMSTPAATRCTQWHAGSCLSLAVERGQLQTRFSALVATRLDWRRNPSRWEVQIAAGAVNRVVNHQQLPVPALPANALARNGR